MTRRAGVLGAVFCLLACAQGAQRPIDPVLAYEAQIARERTPTCVPAQTVGVAFDGNRRDLRQLLHESRTRPPSNPRDAQIFRSSLESAQRPYFEWRQPAAPGGQREGLPALLDPATGAQLSAAVQRIIATSANATAPEELGPIPAPLRPHGLPGCNAALTLTAPARAGETAFVETRYGCGDLCGNGMLYALRNDDSGWRLIAIAFTWVS